MAATKRSLGRLALAAST